MVLRSKDGPLQVSLDSTKGRVTDIGKRLDPASDASFLFTGIYLIEPAFLARIPAGEKISVIPLFLDMIRGGAKLGGVVIDDGNWWDLGTREQYLAVHKHLASDENWIAETAQIDPTAKITGVDGDWLWHKDWRSCEPATLPRLGRRGDRRGQPLERVHRHRRCACQRHSLPRRPVLMQTRGCISNVPC